MWKGQSYLLIFILMRIINARLACLTLSVEGWCIILNRRVTRKLFMWISWRIIIICFMFSIIQRMGCRLSYWRILWRTGIMRRKLVRLIIQKWLGGIIYWKCMCRKGIMRWKGKLRFLLVKIYMILISRGLHFVLMGNWEMLVWKK